MSFCSEAKLRDVIDNRLYYHHFQPIMNIRKFKVIGYESLLRSKYSKSPESIFNVAINLNRLYELDISSVAMAVHAFNSQPTQMTLNTRLFVNIYPSTLTSPLFLKTFSNIIESSLISPDKIVIEINESEKVGCFTILREAIFKIKENGTQVALDDFDKGSVPFKKVIELEPEYIKLDKYFSENLTHSVKKQEILQAILSYCTSNDIQVILEGIETDNDLSVAKSLGVDLVQGYIFGKPDKLNKYL